MTATTMSMLRQQAARGIITIADIRAGERLTSWSLTSGKAITYECTPTQQLAIHGPKVYDEVMCDDTSLTSQSSINNVEANPGSFYWDNSAGKLYVSTPDSTTIWKHTIVADFTLYVSSGSYTTGLPVVLNSNLYWPYFENVGTIVRNINDIYKPSIITSSSYIQLACGTLWDGIIESYEWTNRLIQVLVGGEDLPYSEYEPMFTGKNRRQDWDEGLITFQMADGADELDQSYPSRMITTDACAETYSCYGITYNTGPFSRTPTTINADAATEDVEAGNIWPAVYGKDVFVVPHLLAIGSLKCMTIYGTGISCFKKLTHEVNGAAGTYSTRYVDGSTGALPVSEVDFTNGVVYDGAGSTQRGRYAVVDGPRISGLTNTSDGPVMENPADLIKKVMQDAGRLQDWNETDRIQSRHLCSLMPLQILLNTSQKPVRIATSSTLKGEPIQMPHDPLQKTTATPPKLRNICDRICISTGSVLFINKAGEWSFRTLAPEYSNYVTLDEKNGAIIRLKSNVDGLRTYPKVIVGWGSRTEAAFQLGVGEFSAEESIPGFNATMATDEALTISNTYLATEAGAHCRASRAARWGGAQPRIYEVTVPLMDGLQLDLGKTVKLVKDVQPTSNPLMPVYGVIVSIGLDVSTWTCYLEVFRVFRDRQGFIGPAGSPAWASATDAQRRNTGYYCDDDGATAASNNAAHQASMEW